MGELRRGVVSANIYSLAASPSGGQLAVTSDSNTMHVFNLPTPESTGDQLARPEGDKGSYLNWQKWGGLAKLPFAPRILTDVYSFVNADFDPGEDSGMSSHPHTQHGAPTKARVKGLVGWVDDETIVVLSAGRDARYERFKLSLDENEPASLRRAGWSKYMKPN